MFAVGLHQNGKISWGNLTVLKHANQRQTLAKPCKPSVNVMQTFIVCLDYANQISRCKPVFQDANLSEPE